MIDWNEVGKQLAPLIVQVIGGFLMLVISWLAYQKARLTQHEADISKTANLQQKADIVVKAVEQDAQKGSLSSESAAMHDEGASRLAILAPDAKPEAVDNAIKASVYDMNSERDTSQVAVIPVIKDNAPPVDPNAAD